MGGDEYFSNGICLIEWGEMIESILPKHYTKITFKKNDKMYEFWEASLKEFVGHTPIQVAAGCILGIVLACVLLL